MEFPVLDKGRPELLSKSRVEGSQLLSPELRGPASLAVSGMRTHLMASQSMPIALTKCDSGRFGHFNPQDTLRSEKLDGGMESSVKRVGALL